MYEAKIMRLLQGLEGVPILYWAGQEGEFNVMVMELLGPSLEDMFKYCGKKFTLKTTLLLGKQMVFIILTHTSDQSHRVNASDAIHSQRYQARKLLNGHRFEI